MMGEMHPIWGDGPDLKRMAETLANNTEEIAGLILRVKALEEQIGQTAIITTTPIGGFQPRNRRFNNG